MYRWGYQILLEWSLIEILGFIMTARALIDTIKNMVVRTGVPRVHVDPLFFASLHYILLSILHPLILVPCYGSEKRSQHQIMATLFLIFSLWNFRDFTTNESRSYINSKSFISTKKIDSSTKSILTQTLNVLKWCS